MLARLKNRLQGNKKDEGNSTDSSSSASASTSSGPNNTASSSSSSSSSHHVIQPGSHQRYLQTLKEYSLLLEFKKLREFSPSGIYILPSADSLRRWHGVIFIRKGFYRKGIFKFIIHIPTSYPDEGPRVQFISDIFHPLINPNSGDLDSSIEFPRWDSNQHFIVLLLCYIKKIFFKSDYWEPRNGNNNNNNSNNNNTLIIGNDGFNKIASQLWLKNKEEFLKKCEKCCLNSIERVYVIEEGSPLKFLKPIPVHDTVWKRIMDTTVDEKYNNNNNNNNENNEIESIENEKLSILSSQSPFTATGTKKKSKRTPNYLEWFMNSVQRLNEGVPAPGLISPYLERNSALLPENLPLVMPATLPPSHSSGNSSVPSTPKKHVSIAQPVPVVEKEKSALAKLLSSNKSSNPIPTINSSSSPSSSHSSILPPSSPIHTIKSLNADFAAIAVNSSNPSNSSNNTSIQPPSIDSASSIPSVSVTTAAPAVLDLLNFSAIPEL